VLNKRIKPEQSLAAIENAHDVGIGARLLLMIATPGETYRHTVDLNIAALERLKDKFIYLTVCVFTPLPGSAIWEDPAKYGIKIISKDFSQYNYWIYRRSADGENRVAWSPVRIDGMTVEQQQENMMRMVDFSESLVQSRGHKP